MKILYSRKIIVHYISEQKTWWWNSAWHFVSAVISVTFTYFTFLLRSFVFFSPNITEKWLWLIRNASVNLHIKRLKSSELSRVICIQLLLAQDIFNNCSNDKKCAYTEIETAKLSANPQLSTLTTGFPNVGNEMLCFDL